LLVAGLLTLAGHAGAQDYGRSGSAGATVLAQGATAYCDPSQGIPCPPGSVSPIITNVPSGIPTVRQAPQAPQVLPGSVAPRAASPLQRNKFQDFVAVSLGRDLPMFGYDLFADVPSTFAPVDRVPVTPDYVLGPGDELLIRAWGQIDIDYRAVVDRNGAINIPRVGNINVSGIRYQELEGYLKNAIGRVYRNFELNVALGQLRSIQIFVVGQARRPGNYTVSSLSTLVNALFASGGPSETGSMRRIQLKRGASVVTEFDLYDLLQKGDKSKDARLLPGDVIYIPPIGPLAAVAGGVNVPAIYELRDGTTLGGLLDAAGGLGTTAAGQRVTVERIRDRQNREVDEFVLGKDGLARPVRDGDLVTVYSLSPRLQNAVSLRGFVAQPGRFPWREGMRVRDIIPSREALVSPDYWIRRNALVSSDDWMRRSQSGATGRPGGVPPEIAQLGAGPAQLAQARERTDAARLRSDVKRTNEINWDYAVVERIKADDLTTQLLPFSLGRAILQGDPTHNLILTPGDVITIFSKEEIQVPVVKQTQYVLLEGELANPGVYQIMPGETLRQLVARIGGLSANAYLYGAEFTRESVREQQQRRLNEALDRLSQEVERIGTGAVQTALTSEDVQSAKIAVESQRKLLDRLREVKASGRVVLDIDPNGQMRNLPDLALEDGDRFVVPPRPSVVGVIGAVYNQNSFIHQPNKRVSEYLDQAGGPTRNADDARIYVVRADGSVTGSSRSFFFSGAGSQQLMPGDTIVVPEDLDRYRLSKTLKDWSQIFYQFALGVAGLKVLKDL
jgi:protein involved in polysaccharide export with SLBB domain